MKEIDYIDISTHSTRNSAVKAFYISGAYFIFFVYFFVSSYRPEVTHFNRAGLISTQNNTNRDANLTSLCSAKATKRGPGQKVVSYSFFATPGATRDYFSGIDINAGRMPEFYPGWMMRIYHDYTNESMLGKLKAMENKHPFLDLCFVGDLPAYGYPPGKQQNTWRFLTLADEMVNVTIFRDLDSIFQARELAAVNEWLESNYSLHVMRDHPFHTTVILGGMWGAKLNTGKRHLFQNLTKGIVEFAKAQTSPRQLDQEALAAVIWPTVLREKNFVMQHDSFSCTLSAYSVAGGMRPFPTCRELNGTLNFIAAGPANDVSINVTCPEQCRLKPSCFSC